MTLDLKALREQSFYTPKDIDALIDALEEAQRIARVEREDGAKQRTHRNRLEAEAADLRAQLADMTHERDNAVLQGQAAAEDLRAQLATAREDKARAEAVASTYYYLPGGLEDQLNVLQKNYLLLKAQLATARKEAGQVLVSAIKSTRAIAMEEARRKVEAMKFRRAEDRGIALVIADDLRAAAPLPATLTVMDVDRLGRAKDLLRGAVDQSVANESRAAALALLVQEGR